MKRLLGLLCALLFSVPAFADQCNMLPSMDTWSNGSTNSWVPTLYTTQRTFSFPITLSRNVTDGGYKNIPVKLVKVKPNTKYTLYTDVSASSGDRFGWEYAGYKTEADAYVTDSSSAVNSNATFSQGASNLHKVVTITTTADTEYLVVSPSNWGSGADVTLTAESKIIMVEGDSITNTDIPRCGELPANCNLYNSATATEGSYIGQDGGLAAGQFRYSELIPAAPNTQYTLSGLAPASGAGGNRRLHAYDSQGNWLDNIAVLSSPTGQYSMTATTPANTAYLRTSVQSQDTNVKLEQGSTATAYTPYDASCGGGSTCNNLFTYTGVTYGKTLYPTGVEYNLNSNIAGYSDYIKVEPNTQYTLGTSISQWTSVFGLVWYDSGKQYISGDLYADLVPNETFTSPATAQYVRLSFHTTQMPNIKFEKGSTATEYCRAPEPIKIATTKYNTTAFSGVVTALNTAIDKIKDVVSNTIAQTTAVANLQSGKQQRPDESCPNGKICLLVEDQAGTPHWYEIIERAPGIVPAGSGYTQVEYLQSSGTQYIDTGFEPNINSGMVLDFESNRADSPIQALVQNGAISFGVSSSSSVQTTDFMVYNGLGNDQTLYWRLDNAYGDGTGRYLATIDKQSFSIKASNGATYSRTVSNDAYTMGYNLVLFGRKYNGTVTGSNVKIYSAKLYDDGVMVRDFVPARRNSDGVLGMYDTVSGNFFTNAGSGEFTTPGYLPASYTQLQYLESSGTQWIDTGVAGSVRWVGMGQAAADTTRSQVLLMGNYSGTVGSFVASVASQNKWTVWRTPDTDYAVTSAQPFDLTWTSTGVSGTIGSVNISHEHENGNPLGGTWKICSNNSSFPFAGKLYYFKAYRNGNMIANFVPARNASGVLGMYDLTDTNPATAFHTNQGAGEFTAGPVAQ